MYCVICGKQLNEGNRSGLICRGCREARARQKALRKAVIPINYCYACGNPYYPRDRSIQHRVCAEDEALHSLRTMQLVTN